MRGSRRLQVAVAAILVLAGALITLAYRPGLVDLLDSPFEVAVADIVSIQIDSTGEGPKGPPFERDPLSPGALPLALIEDRIPTPLPATLWQGFSRQLGGIMTIRLAEGSRIVYGPCRHPPEIGRLCPTWST